MRKLFGSLLVVVVVGAVPMFGLANDVRTDKDCANETTPGIYLQIPRVHTNEIDRGAGCISDGDPNNGAELYVGGELNANEGGATIPNEPFGGGCGAIEVMGMQEELNIPGSGGVPMGNDDWGGHHCD